MSYVLITAPVPLSDTIVVASKKGGHNWQKKKRLSLLIALKDFKEAVTKKFVSRKNHTAAGIAEETGVTIKTLYNWADKYSTKYPMRKKSRSTFDKMNLIIKYDFLREEEKGEFLRSNGFI